MHAIDGGFGGGPDRCRIRGKQQVEQAAFGRPGHLDEMRKIDARIRLALRVTPRRDMMTARPDEQSELQVRSGHLECLLRRDHLTGRAPLDQTAQPG